METLDQCIEIVLQEAGIEFHLSGYSYLKDVIKMCIQDKNKSLYGVCMRYSRTIRAGNKTYLRITRSIRYAIQKAWDIDEGKHLCQYFGYVWNEKGRVWSISMFLAGCIEKIKSSSISTTVYRKEKLYVK